VTGGDEMRSNNIPVLVVLGILGVAPFAGVAWQVLHYLEGFWRLGYEVYYVEDSGIWPYDPEQRTVTSDCCYTVNYIAELMDWWGHPDRWAYRARYMDERVYGLSETQISNLFERAEILVNLCGATEFREEHLKVPVRIYLETDPVVPQIEIAQGRQSRISLLQSHTHYFSFGENLGAQDCRVPVTRFNYRPTRQPVILDWWKAAKSFSPQPRHRFTTVSSWHQSQNDIEWNGEMYRWSKHYEFLKFIELPRRTKQPLELALACADATAKLSFPEVVQRLRSHGWQIADAVDLSKNILPYRDYILYSVGEFTVAKDQNIRLRSGWFSDRSACYLAAGLPVITQDTGFGKFIPTGEGLFAFHTMNEILAAFEAINSDYEKHNRAARGIAEEYFRAETVLAKLVEDSGL
jgi:hypothetical protein